MNLFINATCITTSKKTGIERFALRMSQELYRIDENIKIASTIDIDNVPILLKPQFLAASQQLLGKHEYVLRAFWDQTVFKYHVVKIKPDLVFFPIQDGLLSPPVRQIVTVHDLHYRHFYHNITECMNEISGLRKTIYRFKMPRILSRSAAVIAVSEATKRDIVDTFSISPDKIHVVYNGYDEERFRIITAPDPVLQRYGLLEKKYFLFVGSILRHKNLHRLVQAFAKAGGESTLVIAGVCKDEDYLQEVMAAVNSLGLTNKRFLYLEYVPDEDLPYLYNGALAFVLPSIHEGFGVPVIEAMACGTSVITSNCSAMPEVAGGAALLIEPYSVDSIASAMRELLANSRRVEELRGAGLNRAMSFRWSYSAQKLYDVCKMVSES